MDLDIELLTLVEIAVSNDLDDDDGQRLSNTVLARYHSFYLIIIYHELFFIYFISLFADLFDKKIKLVTIMNRQVNVHSKQAHEC